MQSEIKNLSPKKLIGKRITTSLANNKTVDLWRDFMPQRKEIKNVIGSNLFSLQTYDSNYFREFNPTTEFEKWALAEVSDFDAVPDGMETFILPGGLYAVFHYKGLSTDTKIFEYIYGEWLPNSQYTLDARPHFEIMGEKYKNNDPNSEEEIYIPLKTKD